MRYWCAVLFFLVNLILPPSLQAQVRTPPMSAPTADDIGQLWGVDLRREQQVFETSYVRDYPQQNLHQRDSYTPSFVALDDQGNAPLRVVTTIRVAREGVIPVEELDAVLVSGYAPAETDGWLREEWPGP